MAHRPPEWGTPYGQPQGQPYHGQPPPEVGYPPAGYPQGQAPAYPGSYPGQGYPPQPPPRRSSGVAVLVVVVAGVVLLGVIAVVGFLFTRHTGSDPGASTGPETPVATSSAPAQPAGDAAVVGTWRGTYKCNQGLTALRLTIIESPSGDGLAATFRFSAHPTNPSVPSGAYTMRGTLEGGSLQLKGARWIERPGTFVMVGLNAQVTGDRPARIDGQVDGEGCTTFSLQRS